MCNVKYEYDPVCPHGRCWQRRRKNLCCMTLQKQPCSKKIYEYFCVKWQHAHSHTTYVAVLNIVNWVHVWFVKVCCMSSGIHVVHTICDLSYLWNRIRGLYRVCSAMVRMNRQESAEGDVVKREDGVARAFRVQPIPAIEVSGYIWIFRTSKCSGFGEEGGWALQTEFWHLIPLFQEFVLFSQQCRSLVWPYWRAPTLISGKGRDNFHYLSAGGHKVREAGNGLPQ